MFKRVKHFLITGAGIAGSTLAQQFKNQGISYTLIDKQPKSYNSGTRIALPANAIHALKYLKLDKAVIKVVFFSRII